MKERKPLFPEYIWMFFVGLLLAIIVCMRLIPGHADYIVADNPYNDNIIFITLEGKKIHFTSFMGNEIYSTINSNNSDWTEALESDIVSYANNVKLFFGEGNFSVVVVDNYSVSYNYNRFIQLIGPIVGTVYSSYYSGPSEDFLVLNNPWASLSENTFSEYYPTLYTLNLGGYLMPYYKLDSEALPTSTPTPTMAPTTESFHVIFETNQALSGSGLPKGYYCVFVSGQNLNSSSDVFESSVAYPYAHATYGVSNPWICPVFGYGYDSEGSNNVNCYYLYFTGSDVTFTYYYLGTVLASSDIDYIQENYSPVDPSYGFITDHRDNFYGLVVRLNGYSNFTGYSYSSVYMKISYGFQSSSSYAPFGDSGTILRTNPLINAYRFGLTGSSSGETIGPTPTVVPPTPTQAPYVEVILPSGTPTPTPPVTFSGSDLPGGASGEGGSISGAGGMNASEAESIYQYWTNKITNNQALAFLVSFFGYLPFDLVYALGTIIFILILLAMVRLFIHFIS